MKQTYFSLVLGALMLNACGSPDDGEPTNHVIVTCPERPVDPVVPVPEISPLRQIELTETQKTYVSKNNTFALQLAEKTIKADPDNDVLLSPISAAYVLGMIENGANNETKAQIANALGFGNGDEKALNDYFNRLLTGAPLVDGNVEISIANAIMADTRFPLLSDFVDTVSNSYQAKVENYDFRQADMVKEVNQWASDHTNGMIDKVIEEVSPDACMYALNAMYFSGKWAMPFDEAGTSPEDFTDTKGNKQKVQMMHLLKELSYGQNEDFAYVMLPYSNWGWSMNILLPAEGKTVEDVMTSVANGSWQKEREDMALQNRMPCEVNLSLPKFEISSSIEMNDILKELGIVDAFDKDIADFSRMSPIASYLSYVLQKSKIEVDEAGSKAAAVTIGGFEVTSLHEELPIIEFNVNRPFVFMITENTTDTIYFIGVKRK